MNSNLEKFCSYRKISESVSNAMKQIENGVSTIPKSILYLCYHIDRESELCQLIYKHPELCPLKKRETK